MTTTAPRLGRRIVIDPSNTLPFEISPAQRKVYDRDDYKYIIHYLRAFPGGRVPAMEYLLVSFHPLIVKIAGMYSKNLNMEWRDLLSFTMQKFIELVYRFKLESSLYFREYIQLALRRSVRDRVLYDARRRSLNSAISLNATDTTQTGSQISPMESILSTEEQPECYKEVYEKIVSYAARTNELTDVDRKIFRMRFIQGVSVQDTCRKLSLSNMRFLERQQKIRGVLCSYTKKFLV